MQAQNWLKIMDECSGVVKFDILMSTYNGEDFITSQLDSLLSQKDYINMIYIRDDGSTDRTIQIIKEYAKNWTKLIFLIEDDEGNLGPGKSFYSLCERSSSPFVAFCDQDDIWDSSKLSTFSEFIIKNKIDGKSKSALIHCDLKVVDNNLTEMYPSFWNIMNINIPDTLVNILIRNTVTGCACVVSHKLINKYKTKGVAFKLHDHFFASCSALENAIHRINQPLVNYRQHNNNCVGIGRRKKSLLQRMRFFSLYRTFNGHFGYDWELLAGRIRELQRFPMSDMQENQLEMMLKICQSHPIKRIFLMCNNQLSTIGVSKDNLKYLFCRPFNFGKGQ
ncbi:glycosyltransferase family 2 protein [Pseudaeromonas sharmana]|uniref:Glycosyltransferase family 2 protein n=1 Tax=Pseudaeromonas sharmana TaxID=328412 RepID=A0ABV8CSJ3_9GAMM